MRVFSLEKKHETTFVFSEDIFSETSNFRVAAVARFRDGKLVNERHRSSTGIPAGLSKCLFHPYSRLSPLSAYNPLVTNFHGP